MFDDSNTGLPLTLENYSYLPKLLYILILSGVFVFSSCSEKEPEKEYEVAEVPEPPEAIDLYSPEVDSVVAFMTDQQRLNELIWLDVDPSLKIKKETKLSYWGRMNLGSKEIHKLKKDTSYEYFYFTNDVYAPFRKIKGVDDFNEADLNSISDSIFWDKLNKTRDAYFKVNNVDAILCDSLYGLDRLTDSSAQLEFDQLYNEHYLMGGFVDTMKLRYKEAMNNAPILLIKNADSVQQFGDTMVRFYLQTAVWSDSIKEVFKELILLGEYDALKVSVSEKEALEDLTEFIQSDEVKDLINEELLDYKVRKSVAIKLWSKKSENDLKKHLIPVNSKSIAYESKYKGITLINNAKSYLPVTDFPKKKWKYIYIGKDNYKAYSKGIKLYGNVSGISQSLSSFNPGSAPNSPVIILIDDQEIDSTTGVDIVAKVKKASHKCVVVNIGHPENLEYIRALPTLVQVWESGKDYGEHIAQLVMGGNSFVGGVPEGFDVESHTTKKIRLAYTIPEEVGISADSLKKMEKIAAEAVWGGVTPGCQVFLAKEGKVILNKGFGYHTYAQEHKVNTETTYDIASVTKVAATTMCGMHMYDKGYYNLNDSLSIHLPDSLKRCLGHFSRLSNVTFQRLFTHTSGLPAGLPIYKYMMYTDSVVGIWDAYYCDEPNEFFKVEVAKNFYMDSAWLDTLWLETNDIWTGTKEYKYSDANMNVLYQIFRSKLHKNQRYEEYLDSVFYDPLGMDGTAFLPRKNLDTIKHPITPTENETYWRHQLIKGYVHDPNAAMYGGVAGNAGVFSNANDLGILMQMLMNGGSYGGKQYIQPGTVKKFSVHQEGSHRGLGFDKPTESSGNVVAPDCPYTAYGHTGFTGICVWNDPENDLVFVFTSNRVHPNANNKKIITYGIRKRLHQVVYDQLYYNGTYKNEATGNQPVTRQGAPKAI